MSTCSDYLTDIQTKYDDAGYAYEEGYEYWLYLDEYWLTHNFNMTWRLYVVQSLGSLYNIVRQLIWSTGTASGTKRLPYYLEHCVGGNDIDMDAILASMWASDKLRNFHFINYIDAMRAGIWNTEIYETHLQDWYRHFSE